MSMRSIRQSGDEYRKIRILYVGDLHQKGSTCSLRLNAMKKICDNVDAINIKQKPISLRYKIAHHLFINGLGVYLPENCNENRTMIQAVTKRNYDIVWIDKGLTISARTLKYIKKQCKKTVIVNFSPDNMVKRHCQSKQFVDCISLYDYHITTKSFIIDELKEAGAKNVLFVNKTFEPDFHYPRKLDQSDIERLGGDVGFIGAWEKERMNSVLFLSRNGIKVRVWGPKQWQQCKGDNECLTIEDNGLFGDDYAKAFGCFKISLCFLRKINDDQQTARSIEIPACGGFMLAERTKEHSALFEEGAEAEFFGSDEELLEKCRYYLKHDNERREIANNGHRRCINSDYSNENMLKKVLERII